MVNFTLSKQFLHMRINSSDLGELLLQCCWDLTKMGQFFFILTVFARLSHLDRIVILLSYKIKQCRCLLVIWNWIKNKKFNNLIIFFSCKPKMKVTPLRWNVPRRWDMPSHTNSLFLSSDDVEGFKSTLFLRKPVIVNMLVRITYKLLLKNSVNVIVKNIFEKALQPITYELQKSMVFFIF